MPQIELPKLRRHGDLFFNLTLADGGVQVSWDSVIIMQLFMYSEKQRGFAGRCSFEIDQADPHTLRVKYPYGSQRFLGIHRVVVQVELAGAVKTYDARVCNIVASTSDTTVDYDTVLDVPITVSDVDTTIMHEILAACQQATIDANAAAGAADAATERATAAAEASEADHLVAEEDHERAEEDHERIVNRPYISIEYIRRFLYRVNFDRLREDDGGDNPAPGGCSSFVRDGKLFRNLDFKYDNTASFIIRTGDFEGMSFITGLNDGSLDDDLIAQLPYRVVDGHNNSGIMVSTHILFNDWGWTGAGSKSIPLTRLPFLALTKVNSMATIATDLAGILENLSSTPALDAAGYLLQVLVTDGTTTYAILPPPSDNQAFVLTNITVNPKLSNFRWLISNYVTRTSAGIQERPTGIERYNLMPCNLPDLRFTKCYENANRLSEFIGINGTTKDSTDAELEAIYDSAREEYLARQRDGRTWQTMHSVIYGAGIESLFIQENWNDDIYLDRYEKQRQLNEAARQSAEFERELAERERASAETARSNAEALRTLSEITRLDAEAERASSEFARQASESARETSEQSRQTSEFARQVSETARETQSASDHSTALSDHQTASSDHTAAASDHSQAEQDHTRAESDHTTASEDHTASEEATELATQAAEAAMQVVNSMVAKEGDEMTALAIIINQQNARIEALESALRNGLKRLVVDDLEVRHKLNLFVSDGNSYLRGAGAPSADITPENWNEDEYGPWTGVPQYIGQRYLNTSTNKWYTAKGNAAVSDWVQDTNA